MCAIEAGKRGRRVLVIEHADRVGKKILISGGGRCNFTNLDVTPANFLSANPHFCKSALARYTQWDFIALVERHGIAYHEKELGQLFCDQSAQQIVKLLTDECSQAGVRIETDCSCEQRGARRRGVCHQEQSGLIRSASLVVASGGLSVPKMGASGFGYELAKQFGHGIAADARRAGAVDFQRGRSGALQDLSGVASAGASRVSTAKLLPTRCCSPIAASAGRRFCRSRLIGSRAMTCDQPSAADRCRRLAERPTVARDRTRS